MQDAIVQYNDFIFLWMVPVKNDPGKSGRYCQYSTAFPKGTYLLLQVKKPQKDRYIEKPVESCKQVVPLLLLSLFHI